MAVGSSHGKEGEMTAVAMILAYVMGFVTAGILLIALPHLEDKFKDWMDK